MRRAKAGVPEDVAFQTKPEIALQQMRQTLAAGVPPAVALADPAYGNDGKFRAGITELGLAYAVGIVSSSRWSGGPAKHRAAANCGFRPRPRPRQRRDKTPPPVRSRRWPRNLPSMPGRRSPGGRAATPRLPRALPACGCGRRMIAGKAANPRPRSGC